MVGSEKRKMDCLVVGCGLSGSVIARYLAEELGKHVVIWERRNHIAGNMYDYVDEHGILVHQYGPHIFHTNKKYLYDYLCQFGTWDKYNLTCLTKIDGKYTPSPFNFQTIDDYYPSEQAENLKNRLVLAYPGQDKATIIDLLEHPDPVIKEYATFLFEKDYSLYTAKQWGISPTEIDVSVLKRVPILFSYKTGYFDDSYQIMPHICYTHFFQKLLNHSNIQVELGIEALDHLRVTPSGDALLIDDIPMDIPVIYTGALDELLEEKGALPYRSLRFEWKYEEINSLQDAPVVAYPQAEGYTRITEYKKLPVQDVHGTSYAVEYPLPYQAENQVEPYYPILTVESQQHYATLKRKADSIRNLFYCGRLADFRYYNMDQTLERALELCNQLGRYFSGDLA
ncbi:UDP-galactopyranose mutase [Flexilinea flocculi]|uniref:UDP-galactopyranose mutase n=1 Tax=Flexilinea flocculi TaxID=1678840 RepID=A0A0K8P9Y1_9CHLR|nr:UDP-galactopyranose mutase [Flexilinea flocculi]GAP39473.1 UDP-galactopyranose mutase [Flexilinea flocculi]